MNNIRAWFPLYAADFLADEKVVRMSNAEVGMYIKLLCFQWREGSVPMDAESVRKMVGEDVSDIQLATLQQCFSIAIDSDIAMLKQRGSNARLEHERQLAIVRYERRAAAGSKGGKAGLGATKRRNSNAIAKRKQSQSQSQSSSPYKDIPIIPFQIPDSISAESWNAWMANRARKGGADSDHAKNLLLKTLERDAPVLGWTAQQCVDEAVERKWIGFKAAWILKDREQGSQKSYRELDDERAAKDIKERNERLRRLHAAAEAERNGASRDMVRAIADGRDGTSLPAPAETESDVPF